MLLARYELKFISKIFIKGKFITKHLIDDPPKDSQPLSLEFLNESSNNLKDNETKGEGESQ